MTKSAVHSVFGDVMFKCFKSFLVGVLLLQAGAAVAAEIVVPVSRSELIELPVEIGEIIVADPGVADIYVHGKDKVSVIGKVIGRTTIRIFDKENKLLREADVVVGYDLPAIRKALKDFLPYENIGVEMVNTNIALTGQISSASAADKATKIVGEFIMPAFDNREGALKAEDVQRGDAPKVQSKILNLLTISSGQQVMLRVRVGEMRRTALRNLGVNLQAFEGGGDGFSLATGGGLANALGTFTVDPLNTRGTLAGRLQNDSGDGFAAMIEALERDGLFKVLAEPNLVAMSGEKANFLAGGEFPIPIQSQDDQITIEFKPFGVSVEFLPVVISENRIRIQVAPEVSEISEEGAIELNDIEIPAINTRRAKTTIELSPGESFMIAGLIQDEMQSTIEQLPGVGEVPILSALFRSTAYQREETELVLAVTPYIVDPLASSDVKLPTDELQPASVMESFFFGALGTLSDDAERISQTPSLEGPIGFMVD